MPIDLTQYLVIGISSRALFNLEYEDRIFQREGLEKYSQYQIEHENDILQPGAGFPLVQAILRLNALVKGKRKSEVVLMSRNNADTSLRIFNSIEHYGIDISRAALTSGASLAPYLKARVSNLYSAYCRKGWGGRVRQNLPPGHANFNRRLFLTTLAIKRSEPFSKLHENRP